jgi:hypothetical protein
VGAGVVEDVLVSVLEGESVEDFDRRIGELLNYLELLTAGLTFIFVERHSAEPE